MFDKSIGSKQVCQLPLSLIVVSRRKLARMLNAPVT